MTETNAPTQTVERFPSLAAMSAAHRELLKRHREVGDMQDITAGIELFIRKGRATGALLDDEDDRWVAQGLLDYWTTKVYRTGYEPPDGTLDDFDPNLAPELPDDLCPYVGLDAFRENDKEMFFGRQGLIDSMVKLLKENRLLAVIGPSGSGKSSLVMAGLLPKFRAGVLPGSSGWRYFKRLVPGQDPLRDMANLIRPADASDEWVEQQIQTILQSSSQFTLLLEQPNTPPAVIVVDQFEEIFTLAHDETVRMAFINNLIGLAESPNADHRVILTLRIDFVSLVARIPKLQALLEKASVNVTALNASELRDTILRPADLIGLKFEEGLVDELVREVLGEPAALPLLQFTLLKLWESRERNRVTWAAYQKMGGGRKALAYAADELYNSLIPEDQVTCKRILLKIVRPGEGLEVTSNRAPRSALYRMGEARDRVDRMLERLLKSHLLKLSEHESSGEPQVEVAHEALVRNWPLLVEWLDEERANLRNRLRLTAAAKQWRQLARDKSVLLRGVMLINAESYDDLNDLEQEFVEASRAAAVAEQQRKDAAAKQQLEQATRLAKEQEARANIERQRAEDNAKAARESAEAARQLRQRALFLTFALIGAAVFAVAAVGFGRQALINAQAAEENRQEAVAQAATANSASTEAVANEQVANGASVLAIAQQRTAQAASTLAVAQQSTAVAERNIAATAQANAEQNANIAFSRQLAAQALNYLDVQPDLALLLGVEANRVSDTIEARNALLFGLQRGLSQSTVLVSEPLVTGDGYVNNVAFSPDGQILAIATEDGPVVLLDTTDRTLFGVLEGHQAKVFSVAFSPDGKTLASASADGMAILWDYRAGQSIFQTPKTQLSMLSVAFSPDGRLFAVSRNDSRIEVWDAATLEQIGLLEGHRDSVWSIAWSPDSRQLASASNDNTTRLWDSTTGKPLLTLRGGHTGAVRFVVWTPDGKQLVTAGVDGLIIVWDAVSGRAVGDPLRGHTDRVIGLAFSPDGDALASASADRSVILWNFADRRPIDVLHDHEHWVVTVAFSPDGKLLASGSIDESIVLRQIVVQQQLGESLGGRRGNVQSAVTLPDGQVLIVARSGSNAALWDYSGNTQLAALGGYQESVFSHDGTLLALIGEESLALYDLNAAAFSAVQFDNPASTPLGLAFSPDNTILAAALCGETDVNGFCVKNTVQFWDVSTGQQTTAQNIPHTDSILSLAFSPDGKLLATGSQDKTIILLDTVTYAVVGLPLTGHTDKVTSLTFSPDGHTLASGSADKTMILWDVITRQSEGRPFSGHLGALTALAFNADGSNVYSGSDTGEVFLWTTSVEAWERRACEIAKRNLTQAEWNQFLTANLGAYHKTCEQWPEGQ